VDFFQSQELARRNTRRLVIWLAMAILAMIGAIYGVVFAVVSAQGQGRRAFMESGPASAFDPAALGAVAGGVLSIVGAGSAYKVASLRGGGETVASLLGGRKIPPNSSDPDERRILNVVEEMAIASGTPVPPVFVLDNEPGINAFAAGYTVDDAVIGINRGTIRQLTRDELQGVVAHEFSHILNGDMRMSIRMIGLLHGIQVLALIGYYVLRASSSGSRRSSDNKGAGGVVIVAIAVIVVGWIGLFFARIIKAAVSRQREYLADASAVQFTRNPEGIAGALKMIAASQHGSVVNASHAEEASHMFFASMFPSSSLAGMFATHPPLLDRIRKLDPNFDGDLKPFINRISRPADDEQEPGGTRKRKVGPTFGFPIPGPMGLPLPGMSNAAERFPIDPVTVVAGIGSPDEQDVVWSEMIVDKIPSAVADAARDVFLARALVFATLLAKDAEVRTRQLEIVRLGEGEATFRETERLAREITGLQPRFRLPVFEIIQGTLTGMSQLQYRNFRETVDGIVRADNQIDLFEFFMQQHLLVHLDRRFGLLVASRVAYTNIGLVKGAACYLLEVLARAGHDSAEHAAAAFRAACTSIGTDWGQTWGRVTAFNHEELRAAIEKLNQASPAVKKRVLTAAATAVTHDGKVTATEAELFRALAESLDCPVPLIVATINR
jgi:Zn-dependent protease with chaperone function